MSMNLDILNNLKIKYNPHAELINGIYVNLNNYNIDKRIEFDQSKRDIFIDRLITTGVLKIAHDNVDEVADDEIKDDSKDEVVDDEIKDDFKNEVKYEVTDDKNEIKDEDKDKVKDKIETKVMRTSYRAIKYTITFYKHRILNKMLNFYMHSMPKCNFHRITYKFIWIVNLQQNFPITFE
jgi:hypothetical protein